MMTSSLWTAFTTPSFGVAGLAAQEQAALIMLAASLLLFRTFRERYLLIWILGWLALFVSGWTIRTAVSPLPRLVIASSQAEFVLAVCLFAAALFIYTGARKALGPLLLVTGTIIACALVRALWWLDSMVCRE